MTVVTALWRIKAISVIMNTAVIRVTQRGRMLLNRVHIKVPLMMCALGDNFFPVKLLLVFLTSLKHAASHR